MKWSQRGAVLAALGVVLATNAIALGGVAFNRYAEPESTLALSEREVELPYDWRRGRENSGLAVSIRWRVLDATPALGGRGGSSYRFGAPAWLTEAKLRALGFTAADLDRPESFDSGRRRTPLPREVLVVLELDGAAYAESLARTEREAATIAANNERGEGQRKADGMLGAERTTASRLFAIDAGLDVQALRKSHPDRTRYAIVPGQVEPSWTGRGAAISGFISHVGTDAINVPLELREAFGEAPAAAVSPGAPRGRYRATVAFGQRLEPWLLAAERR